MIINALSCIFSENFSMLRAWGNWLSLYKENEINPANYICAESGIYNPFIILELQESGMLLVKRH